MNRIIVAALVAAFSFAVVVPADASPYLSKSRARVKARSMARHLYNDLDAASDYSVNSCSRVSTSIVECDYSLWMDDDSIRCDDTVRVRLTNYGLYGSFPYESDCDYV